LFNLNQNRGVNMKVKEDLTMSIILNYATDTLGNMNWFISAFLFTSSLTLFYLEDFKLSNIRLIKYIQIFSFVCIPFYIIYYMFNIFNPSLTDLITYMADNKDVNLHGHVKVDKEAGKAIGQGLQTIGSQIGLGATIAGVATAVGKTIAKSSLPPVQKAGVVVGAGLLGGLFHSSISQYNIRRNYNENITNIMDTAIINDSNINKFINDNVSSSPLEVILSNLELTNYICIYMLIILIIQILFKFHFKDDIRLKLSSILGNKLNRSLESIINKVITLNKKMSIFYIWLILISVIISLCFSIFFITDISNNLEDYIKIYKSFKSK